MCIRDSKQAVRTQLIAGIANTYYTLLMLDNQLAISVRTEKSWKETVDATRALMEAGLANDCLLYTSTTGDCIGPFVKVFLSMENDSGVSGGSTG